MERLFASESCLCRPKISVSQLSSRLANTALGPNAVRFKASSMPFVQMENISHFLRICQEPPLSLPPHDVFLTVDLYESKDPAQVLQCVEAFSRRASAINPNRIPIAIGGRRANASMSPQSTGASSRAAPQFSPRARGESNASLPSPTFGGRTSPSKDKPISPPSKKFDGSAAPAWNYAQYGWMGGASQGNQGVTFGGRRQITSAAPQVPSLAEKERKRREAEAEAERLRIQAEEEQQKRRAEMEAEEERTRAERARRLEEEARKRKEEERRQVEEEKRRWEEEERRWREEEETRIREEREAEERLEQDRRRRRANSDARLKGQFLSQYQAEQRQTSAESERIQELERQLAEAKERERRYEEERQEKGRVNGQPTIPKTAPKLAVSEPRVGKQSSKPEPEDGHSWQDEERDYLRQAWSDNQPTSKSPRPLPTPNSDYPVASQAPSLPSRPLPEPTSRPLPNPTPKQDPAPQLPARPLPDPSNYRPQPLTPNRTDRYLASNPPPVQATPSAHLPSEAAFSSSAEADAEASRRVAAQKATKAGGWASKSLLEREMERERQRQQEWEESQKQTQEVAQKGMADPAAGSGPGQSWDVNTYGFTGGDSQNKGAQGIYSGRRQILGPRPMGK